jgi:hypothetical protein
VAKPIRLQHRTYLGADNTAKYNQYRINISDYIIKRLDWSQENQIVLNLNYKKKIIILKPSQTKK